jgi:hypothetical protein
MELTAKLFWCLLLILLSCAISALADEPRVLLTGCQLEQIAREPEMVTPVGMAFDAKGRLLAIESHTHQRPEDYEGPASDRLRMLSDSNGDGTRPLVDVRRRLSTRDERGG